MCLKIFKTPSSKYNFNPLTLKELLSNIKDRQNFLKLYNVMWSNSPGISSNLKSIINEKTINCEAKYVGSKYTIGVTSSNYHVILTTTPLTLMKII